MAKMTKDQILRDAENLTKRLRSQGQRPSWSDYEKFKRMLAFNDVRGAEKELAESLNL